MFLVVLAENKEKRRSIQSFEKNANGKKAIWWESTSIVWGERDSGLYSFIKKNMQYQLRNWTPKWSYSCLISRLFPIYLFTLIVFCLLDDVSDRIALVKIICHYSTSIPKKMCSPIRLSLIFLSRRRQLPWITLLVLFLFVAWYSILSIRSCRVYSTIIRIVSCRPGRVVIYLIGKRHSLLLAVGAKIVRVARNCEKKKLRRFAKKNMV